MDARGDYTANIGEQGADVTAGGALTWVGLEAWCSPGRAECASRRIPGLLGGELGSRALFCLILWYP
jgi:hypothetical protein